ncbi:MAG: C10 family peptidase [Phycisphaerales bacterium]|nr:MAG: C10 family peptidase [Phycisphaerales bacterium]
MRSIRFYVKIELIMILLSVSLGIEAASSSANLQDLATQDVQMIEVEVARFAAMSALPLFYEGGWQYFDHLVYYDLEGRPVTYAIIFKRQLQGATVTPESIVTPTLTTGKLETLEDGTMNMREAADVLTDQISEIKVMSVLSTEEKALLYRELAEQKSEIQRLIYGMDEFATVVTGAREDMPLIVKCYEGFPPAFVKKSDAEALAQDQDPSGNWHIKRLIYLDRFTEAVEVVRESGTSARILTNEEGVVVNMRTYGIEQRSTLRQRFDKARLHTGAGQQQADPDNVIQRNRRVWQLWRQQALDGLLQADSSDALSGETILTESEMLPVGSDQKIGTNSPVRDIAVRADRADLRPYQLEGWADTILVTDGPDQTTDTTVYAYHKVFLKCAYANFGYADTASFWVRIEDTISEQVVAEWKVDPVVAQGISVCGGWVKLLKGSSSTHGLKVTVDSRFDVSESDEDNNTYTRSIHVHDDIVRKNEIPGASNKPYSSVPVYVNNQAVYDIPGYPNDKGICVATATADILGYWDRTPYEGVTYSNLVANIIAPLRDTSPPNANVRDLVVTLGKYYYVDHYSTDQVKREAIRYVANELNGYGFDVQLYDTDAGETKNQLFQRIRTEIDAARPVLWGVDSLSQEARSGHAMPVIGYVDCSGTDFDSAFVHVNLTINGDDGRSDEYVYWYGGDLLDVDSDDIVTIIPGISESGPSKATNPTPVNGATNQLTTVNLSWSDGGGASSYDIYLGTDSSPDAGEFKRNQSGQTYNSGTLQYDTTYYWRIDAKNMQGTATGDVWRFTTTKPGGGVKGQYYLHYKATPPDPPSNAFTTHMLTRTDPQINFNWGNESPDPSIHYDYFSAKWTGEIRATFTEPYTFYTMTDDGVKLWVDGRLLVDNWTNHAPIENAGTIDLVAGRTYSLEMWWYEYGGGAVAELRWWSPHTPKQLVPQSALSTPIRASSPEPLSGAVDVQARPMLTWTPGEFATSHRIYFGSNESSVRNATTASGEYRGMTPLGSERYEPGMLDYTSDYYWRVDEVSSSSPGSVLKGPVWSFTTGDFIVVDNFESYNDLDETDPASNRIYLKWIDGFETPTNGAFVGYMNPPFAEQDIVHGGIQSMPVAYDNQGTAKYSEAVLTLDSLSDWTEQGVVELSLWFRGHPASVGSFTEGPGQTYRISASGADIWNYHDEFHYAYKRLSGMGTIIARVDDVQNTNEWAKAGVMIRETLKGNSKFAAVYITPGNGCRFQARLSTNDYAQSDTSVSTAEQRAITAPYWVKLERGSGNVFRGYYSTNGSSWQPMSWNPQSIPMSSDVYVGLALTSHDASLTCQASFSGVRFTGSVRSQWANQDIGIISNDPERMYVAISNRNRTPAVVYNDDPSAVRTGTWTEWTIPLEDFANRGVNLRDVETMAIGFGNRSNTSAPGGAGTVYFDDIRLYQPR